MERILRDYVQQQCADFVAIHGEAAGTDLFAARLLDSLGKLAKRLGGDRYQALRGSMQAALVQQRSRGDLSLHRDWIAALMRDYYDPMYAYQRLSRADRIVFQGDHRAVLDFLRSQSAPRG